MSNIFRKIFVLSIMAATLTGCEFWNRNLQDVLNNPFRSSPVREPASLRMPSSVVVCRTKQCAPAKLSMSREYIHNSLLHLFQNNSRKTGLVCEADPGTHACTENYIQLPVTVGIIPAYFYIDSFKLTDVSVAKDNTQLNLVINYNVTYNGQTPDCLPAQTMVFVKNTSNILFEDPGYMCKMNAIGQTSIKTVFSIDYIDLDYGYIGGYYSIGLSGPSYGGGTGYMLLKLPDDAYPLAPNLRSPRKTKTPSKAFDILEQENPVTNSVYPNSNVKVYPIRK